MGSSGGVSLPVAEWGGWTGSSSNHSHPNHSAILCSGARRWQRVPVWCPVPLPAAPLLSPPTSPGHGHDAGAAPTLPRSTESSGLRATGTHRRCRRASHTPGPARHRGVTFPLLPLLLYLQPARVALRLPSRNPTCWTPTSPTPGLFGAGLGVLGHPVRCSRSGACRQPRGRGCWGWGVEGWGPGSAPRGTASAGSPTG